jgi:NitT/TauT family transport system permease protein
MNSSTIKNKGIQKSTIAIISGCFFLFFLWLILSYVLQNNLILPTPKEVFVSLIELGMSSHTYLVFFSSLLKIILVMVTTTLLAGAISFLSTQFSFFKNFFVPFVTLLKTIPVASIILLLLIIFGKEEAPLLICFCVVFPILYEGFVLGFDSISKDILDELKLLPGSETKKIFEVELPISMNTILSTFLQAFGLGFKVMIMAEFLAQPTNSIGREMMFAKEYLEIPTVFAWTLLLLVFVGIVDTILHIVKNHLR